ncbi:hypothetical protein Phum_PHUM581060 [Pediculus humanus corporis]|uniref:Uncharacterized protein n=1 Tax=Pediculus humanus subsp. corporis TaxID=121224 RepID=E0W213_PEDHC|nr:uncharacterized protein Phum_PHUM581060 [Pediculus humanus corporis]EEB19607.1 hypothetical protein Phum_PHUM581060 [Pediculus humanus corporis]
MLQGVESTDNNLTSVKNEKNYAEGLQQKELRMMQGKYMKNNDDSTGKINKFNGELLCFLTESPFRILRGIHRSGDIQRCRLKHYKDFVIKKRKHKHDHDKHIVIKN